MVKSEISASGRNNVVTNADMSNFNYYKYKSKADMKEYIYKKLYPYLMSVQAEYIHDYMIRIDTNSMHTK